MYINPYKMDKKKEKILLKFGKHVKELRNQQQFSDNIIFIVQGKLLQFRQYKLRWQTDSANLLTLP